MNKLVKYMGASDEQVSWGNNDDPRGLLIKGEIYEVVKEDVRSFHTKITLGEYEDKVFNKASFEEVEMKEN